MARQPLTAWVPPMRVAAIYDIHANLPALEAVIEDIRDADVDRSSSAATCSRGRCRARRSSGS